LSFTRPRTPGRAGALSLVAVCVAGAVLSVLGYQRDTAWRRRAEAFGRDFTLSERRPEKLDAARFEGAGDLIAAAVARIALLDALEGVGLANLSPEARQLWLDAAYRLDDEMVAAEGLVRSALVSRPGWAYHRFLLGQLAYARARRLRSPELLERPARWAVPLRLATTAAPGDDATWTYYAGAALELWAGLPGPVREEALPVLKRAFADPPFVSRAFPSAVAGLGPEAALGLLPDEPAAFASAREVLGRTGDREALARVQARWERLEERARTSELARIEDRYQKGDRRALRDACRRFVRDHPTRELDRPESRRQAARVLEVWPEDRGGSWRSDPRAELLRFFLDGRTRGLNGAALLRAVDELAEVPDPVKARLLLLGGDRYGYEKLLRLSETSSTLEWTPFYLDLARRELEAGLLLEAEAALEKIPRQARGECEVLLVRRDVSRAKRVPEATAELEAALAASAHEDYPPELWSGRSLWLCVDATRDRDRFLEVRVRTRGPALVAYGWDGGRGTTELVEGEKVLSVPMSGRSGRRSFSVETVAGPLVEVLGARPSSSAFSDRLPQSPEDQVTPSATARTAGIAGSEKLNSTSP
jgi:hypothetical protein